MSAKIAPMEPSTNPVIRAIDAGHVGSVTPCGSAAL